MGKGTIQYPKFVFMTENIILEEIWGMVRKEANFFQIIDLQKKNFSFKIDLPIISEVEMYQSDRFHGLHFQCIIY